MPKSLSAGGPAKVIIHLELDIGSIEEIGFGGLKQQWVASEKDGMQLAITSGAGLGSSLLEASVIDGTDSLYAKADIHQFGALIFDALIAELRRRQQAREAGGDEGIPADGTVAEG